jgi:hypothetical protein
MAQGYCPTCDQLWQKHGAATTRHMSLLEEGAATSTDPERSKVLHLLIEASAISRKEARRAIELHMTNDHYGEGARRTRAAG